jgi:hypothetical protein
MAEAANGEVASEAKRAAKTQRLFYNKAGEESNRVGLDTVAWKLIYVPTGDHWEGKLDDLTDEVRNAAALFGLITNITNAIGSKALTDAECIESIEARLEAFKEGRWTAERETGPRTSDLVAAMRALAAEQGRDFTEEQATALGAKFADETNGPAERKKYMGNPQFKAHFDAIKLQRAQERLAKSKAAAAEASKTDADDLFQI